LVVPMTIANAVILDLAAIDGGRSIQALADFRTLTHMSGLSSSVFNRLSRFSHGGSAAIEHWQAHSFNGISNATQGSPTRGSGGHPHRKGNGRARSVTTHGRIHIRRRIAYPCSDRQAGQFDTASVDQRPLE
jgi:hypothetical protein